MVTQVIKNTEEILNCDEYATSLLEHIKLAKHSIDLETYIFADDSFGKSVALLLSQAAARGVQVRLMVDGIGTPTLGDNLALMESAGVMIRIFHPVPWRGWQWIKRQRFKRLLTKLYNLMLKLNIRNHRKTCIIDNRIIFVGSMNISQKHLSASLLGESWVDVIIKLIDVNPDYLQFAFNKAWRSAKYTFKKSIPIELNPRFRLNFSRRLRRALYKSLLARIKHSHERVWMTNAYFNPDAFLLKRLTRAAKKGIDVKIILPFQSDVIFMPIIARTFYADLLKAGVKIYEYQPHILHSKTLIIDDWFCMGSSNLNQRSLKHDLEVDVVLFSDPAKYILTEQFHENLTNTKKIEQITLIKMPFYYYLLGRILLFARYFF